MVENILLYFSFPVLAISMILILYRVIKGPGIEDRIVALDLLSVYGIAFIVLYSIFSDESVFIDAGIILALLAFIGTVAFAYYIERKCKK